MGWRASTYHSNPSGDPLLVGVHHLPRWLLQSLTTQDECLDLPPASFGGYAWWIYVSISTHSTNATFHLTLFIFLVRVVYIAFLYFNLFPGTTIPRQILDDLSRLAALLS